MTDIERARIGRAERAADPNFEPWCDLTERFLDLAYDHDGPLPDSDIVAALIAAAVNFGQDMGVHMETLTHLLNAVKSQADEMSSISRAAQDPTLDVVT